MKRYKLATILFLALTSCSQEDVTSPRTISSNSPAPDEVIVFEKGTPRANKAAKEQLRSQLEDSSIEWYKQNPQLSWMGHSYWFNGEDVLEKELKGRIINIQGLANDPQFSESISILREKRDTLGFSAYRDYLHLRRENRRYQKIGGGFKFSLFGIKVIDFSTSHEKTFYSLRESFDTALWGEGHIVHVGSSVNLQSNPTLRARVIEKHLSSGFIRELYNSPIGQIKEGYGPLVLCKYLMGGKVSAKYLYTDHSNTTQDSSYSAFSANLSLPFGFTEKDADKDGNAGFNKNSFNFALREIKTGRTFISIQTLGGKPSLGINLPVNSSNSGDFDRINLSSWHASLEDESTHSLIDVKPEGLLPISEFILEDNFKRRIMDTYGGVLNSPSINNVPKLEISKVFVRNSPQGKPLCDIAVVLSTRNDDKLLLTSINESATDEELERNNSRDVFIQKGKELVKQVGGLFKGLAKEGRPNKILYPYLRTTLCSNAVVNFPQMCRYKNPLNNVVYIYDPKSKVAFSFYQGDEGDENQGEVYGILDFVSGLPEKKISILNLLQNYRVLGL